MKKIIGVDEAGRGPLAGPVAVGVVIADEGFDFLASFPGLNDSKKLSEKRREEIFTLLLERTQAEELSFCVKAVDALTIDRVGIAKAVRSAVHAGVRSLAPEPSLARVYLDGLLKAPEEYEQETVVHGDGLVPAIMLASVAAKVTRDRLMVKLAEEYPAYGFDRHKGYGTKAHYKAITLYGPCELHRRTFLKGI